MNVSAFRFEIPHSSASGGSIRNSERSEESPGLLLLIIGTHNKLLYITERMQVFQVPVL
jgi:hypothetical protein